MPVSTLHASFFFRGLIIFRGLSSSKGPIGGLFYSTGEKGQQERKED